VLDIGTGSGCIAIALKKHRPNWNVFAIDVSEEALEVAKINASKNNTDIEFFQHDILLNTDFFVDVRLYMEREDASPLKLDIIVSNPPYIPLCEQDKMSVSTIQHEPHLALFVDNKEPLLFYDKIADFALQHLNHRGYLYVELNEFNTLEVQQLIVQKGFEEVILHKDLASKNRMLSARI